MTTWTEADLARLGADSDGRRRFAPNPALRLPASRSGATAGQHAQAAAEAVNAEGNVGSIVSGDVGAPRNKSRGRPEEALQVSIVRAFRPQLVPGARLFATNGELPGGAEQVRRAGRRKAMGYMRGTPDLCARRPGFLGWIEAKTGRNRQTPEQVQWAEWAQRDCGDGYAVVNSVEDAGAVLRAWGFVA